MPATPKSAPKKSRPTFAAPTPPDSEKVVQNAEEEVAENITSEPIDTKAASPTPPKFITKGGPDKEASFDQVLSQEQTQEEQIQPEPHNQEGEPVEEVDLTDEAEADISSPFLEETDTSSTDSPHKLLKTILILLLLLVAITGWGMYLTTKYPDLLGSSISLGSSTPTPTPTITPAPPTPTPVDRSGISIQILNGAGVSGAAAATATTLEDMGYTITDTGNADNTNYEITEIYTTPEFPDNLTSVLLEDLKKEFGSASISGQLDTLPNEANTRIVLGSDWVSEAE